MTRTCTNERDVRERPGRQASRRLGGVRGRGRALDRLRDLRGRRSRGNGHGDDHDPDLDDRLFGWLFVLTSAGFVIFSAYLAISRYGNIKLGPDDSEPEFSTFSWVSMMFATGMGIGLMFWGVAEPLTHLNTPPMGHGRAGDAGGGAPGHGVHLLPLGLPPLVDVRRDRARDRLLRLPQGQRQPGLGHFRPLLGDRAAGGPARRSTCRDLRDALRLGHLARASARCRSPAASTTSSAGAAAASPSPSR